MRLQRIVISDGRYHITILYLLQSVKTAGIRVVALMIPTILLLNANSLAIHMETLVDWATVIDIIDIDHASLPTLQEGIELCCF